MFRAPIHFIIKGTREDSPPQKAKWEEKEDKDEEPREK
jgi:hypothetical protein